MANQRSGWAHDGEGDRDQGVRGRLTGAMGWGEGRLRVVLLVLGEH